MANRLFKRDACITHEMVAHFAGVPMRAAFLRFKAVRAWAGRIAWAGLLTVSTANVACAQEVAPSARPPEGLLEILFAGGPLGVAIMLVLIGLSLSAAYLVFEHFLSIRRDELLPQDLRDQLAVTLQAGSWNEAESACEQQPGFLAFVISQGLAEREAGWPAVEKALEDALAEQAARLMRRVEYLAVIGNIAPMVGLLGTVTGMILAFRAVARSQGAAGPGELAEGIYQALITTVVGLIIAIPALGAFAVMRNRVDQLIAEATYLVQHLTRPLKRSLSVPAIPASLSAPPAPPRFMHPSEK